MALSLFTPPPPEPEIDDDEEQFDDKAFALVAWYEPFVTQLNALVAWLNLNIGAYVIVTKTDTSTTLSADDAGKYMRFTNASAKTLTVNASLSGNLVFNIRNVGAGDLTFVADGVTINAPAGGTLVIPQRGTASLVTVSGTEFDLIGQTVAE